MSAFGERLRREREMRGISLDEIAAATKIGTRLLRALEEENFDLLPGGIFNKSYVREYCKHVGIDEEQAVAEYLEVSGEAAPDVRVIARQNASARAEYPTAGGGTFPLVPLLIFVVAIAGAAGAWHIFQERQRDRAQRAAISGSSATAVNASAQRDRSSAPGSNAVAKKEAAPSVSASKPSAGLASPTASASVKEAGAPFELTVRAKEPAWVSIKSDGKIMVRGIIKPPDVKTVHATDQVVFWTGNAGAVEVSYNGKDVPLKAGENEEREMIFDSHGMLPSSAHP